MPRSVLLGEYDFTLDAKNRVAVPARLRPAFTEGIFLTRGFEKYITAFPPEEWDRFVAARTGDLPEMSEEGRRMRRFIFGAAVSDELDAQGRVKVPAYLLEYAGLGKDVTIIGVQDHVELWDRAAWARYRKQMEEGADASADRLSVQ